MNKFEDSMNIQPGESYSVSGTDLSGQPIEPVPEKTARGVRPYLAGRKEFLVQQLNDTASALHQTGNQLSNRRSGELFKMSAEKIGRLSDYLEVHDVDQLVDDFKTYATSRPWLVMGGAFLVGMAAARFFKATDPSHRSPAPFEDDLHSREVPL